MKEMKEHIMRYKTIYIPALVASILGVLAFFWVPVPGYDLYEYYNWTYKFSTFNFNDTLKFIMTNGEIISMSYFCIMSKIGIYQLIQVIPTIVFYFLAFYMILDYSKMKKIPVKYTLFVSILFLSLFKFIFIVGCFRYSLAYMLFAFGLYLNYIKLKNSKAVWLLYVLPIFIHTSTLLLLLFRLLALIKNRKIKITLVVLGGILALFPGIMTFMIDLLPDFKLLEGLKNKVEYYFIQENIPISLQYFFRMVQAIVLIGLMCYWNIKHRNDNDLQNYNKCVEIACIIILLSFFNYTIFARLSDFLLMISIPYLLSLLSSIKGKYEKFFIYSVLLVFIVGGIRIQIPIFQQMYF